MAAVNHFAEITAQQCLRLGIGLLDGAGRTRLFTLQHSGRKFRLLQYAYEEVQGLLHLGLTGEGAQ